jgi:predicted transcriptional regulator
MFIGLFIFLGARQESAHVTQTEMLKNVRVRELMLTNFKLLRHTDTLHQAVQQLLAAEQQDFLVENEWGKVIGLLTRDNLLRGISERGMDTPVSSVVIPAISGIQADQPAMSVFEMLTANGAPAAPVMEGEQLVGMLTLANIREYFLVRFAVELNKN